MKRWIHAAKQNMQHPVYPDLQEFAESLQHTEFNTTDTEPRESMSNSGIYEVIWGDVRYKEKLVGRDVQATINIVIGGDKHWEGLWGKAFRELGVTPEEVGAKVPSDVWHVERFNNGEAKLYEYAIWIPFSKYPKPIKEHIQQFIARVCDQITAMGYDVEKAKPTAYGYSIVIFPTR